MLSFLSTSLHFKRVISHWGRWGRSCAVLMRCTKRCYANMSRPIRLIVLQAEPSWDARPRRAIRADTWKSQFTFWKIILYHLHVSLNVRHATGISSVSGPLNHHTGCRVSTVYQGRCRHFLSYISVGERLLYADDKKPLVNASCLRKWITPSARDSQQMIVHFSGKLLPELDCHTSRWWTVFELRTAIRINKSSLSAGGKHTVQELPTVGTASDQRSNISLRMTSDTVTPLHISPTHISTASPSCFWLLSLSFSLFATSLAKDLWTLEKAVGWAQ